MYQPEKLKGDAKMIAEVEVLLHVDDVVEVVFVFPLYHVQDLQLDQSLVMKPAEFQEIPLRCWKTLYLISPFISQYPDTQESESLNVCSNFGHICVHSCR